MELKQGDVVRLISGGPDMTVVEYPFTDIDGKKNGNIVKCQWFNNDKHLKHGTFEIETLIKL